MKHSEKRQVSSITCELSEFLRIQLTAILVESDKQDVIEFVGPLLFHVSVGTKSGTPLDLVAFKSKMAISKSIYTFPNSQRVKPFVSFNNILAI